MKRRTLMRKLGATGIATTALSGPTAAAKEPTLADLGFERKFDVSAIEGRVTYDELLAPHELRALPADVDPTEQFVVVAPEADSITPQGCCAICCEELIKPCDCSCWECDFVDGCTDS